MNRKSLLYKVLNKTRNNISWNEFICSLTKEELKDYLNSENYYLSQVEETMDCDDIYKRLQDENQDGEIHVYIDKDYQGCTERIKDMFIYQNGAVYKTYKCVYDKVFDSYQMGTDHYGLKVNARGLEDFKNQLSQAIYNHPTHFQIERDEIYSILRYFRKGIVKLF